MFAGAQSVHLKIHAAATVHAPGEIADFHLVGFVPLGGLDPISTAKIVCKVHGGHRGLLLRRGAAAELHRLLVAHDRRQGREFFGLRTSFTGFAFGCCGHGGFRGWESFRIITNREGVQSIFAGSADTLVRNYLVTFRALRTGVSALRFFYERKRLDLSIRELQIHWLKPFKRRNYEVSM